MSALFQPIVTKLGFAKFNIGFGAPVNPTQFSGVLVDSEGAVFAASSPTIDHYWQGLPFDEFGRVAVEFAAVTSVDQALGFTANGYVALNGGSVDRVEGGLAYASGGGLAGAPGSAATSSMQVSYPLLTDFVDTVGGLTGSLTRVGVKNRVNNNTGLVEAFASGVAGFVGNGLSIDGATVNLCLQNVDLSNGTWSQSGLNQVDTDALLDPTGITSEYALIEVDTSTGAHLLSQNITLAAATDYTWWGIFQAFDSDYDGIRLNLGLANVDFDFTLGTVTGTGGSATGNIKALANNNFLCELRVASGAGGSLTHSIQVLKNGTTSYTGDAGSGIYAYRPQVQLGTGATVGIDTTTVAVTSVADYPSTAPVTSMPTNNFSIYIECDFDNIEDGTNQALFDTRFTGGNDGIAVFKLSTDNSIRVFKVVGGVTAFVDSTTAIVAPGDTVKVLMSQDSTTGIQFIVDIDGVQETLSDPDTANALNANEINIGNLDAHFGAARETNGPNRDLKLFTDTGFTIAEAEDA